MTDVVTLLPDNATPVMLALEQTTAEEPRIAAGVDSIVNVKGVQPPSFLDALLWEYGLTPLAAFVPNKYALLVDGRTWQIERDTFAAVARGLGWLGLAATIDEALPSRNWWNSFQLYLDSLPAADDPDLSRIEHVTDLSVPFQSDFRRGVYGYDVPAATGDGTRLDGSMLDFESGIALREGGPVWSFGVTSEIDHVLTEDEGTALGIWIAPVLGGSSITWEEATLTWEDAAFSWIESAATARAVTMASFFEGLSLYMAFKTADSAIIGYRRVRSNHQVGQLAGGRFAFGTNAYEPDAGGGIVYFEALTAFGMAEQTITSVSIVVGASRAAGVPAGRLWLDPGDLSGGTEIIETALSLTLRPTVRQRVKVLLRF